MTRLTLTFLVAAAIHYAPVAAHAQAPGTASVPDTLDVKSAASIQAEYRIDLTSVHDNLMALANAIPADRYDWRPVPGVRSVSEVLMHIVGEWYYICPISVGHKAPADFGPPAQRMRELEAVTLKAEVLRELDKSWAFCLATLTTADPARLTGRYEPAKMPLARAALRVAGDQHEHLGQLIAYARSVGVTPPWSR